MFINVFVLQKVSGTRAKTLCIYNFNTRYKAHYNLRSFSKCATMNQEIHIFKVSCEKLITDNFNNTYSQKLKNLAILGIPTHDDGAESSKAIWAQSPKVFSNSL